MLLLPKRRSLSLSSDANSLPSRESWKRCTRRQNSLPDESLASSCYLRFGQTVLDIFLCRAMRCFQKVTQSAINQGHKLPVTIDKFVIAPDLPPEAVLFSKNPNKVAAVPILRLFV